MRSLCLALAFGALLLASPAPSLAQGAAAQAEAEAPRRSRAARPKREPSVGQLAARERQKKCGVEWKEAKAKGATGGLKWPKFYSQCNARLKGNSA